MLFNSPEYFVFLAVVLLLYYSLTHRWQNYMLLVASYFFYGLWDYRFLSLILLTTIIDYVASHAIYRQSSPRTRKLFLLLSVGTNLGILGFFKYFNFFIDNAERLLSLFGLQATTSTLYIILPVGISFYTFQTMSYTIDVYRGKIKPADNFWDFALYICYFPQLVAGPIERAAHLLPAIQSKRVVTTEAFVSGSTLILIGLFRKVVIADGLAIHVDPIFAAPQNYSSPELAMAVYLFALQIYCDFAGYSDIARGSSRLLGIELMLNFNQPYFAANIQEFWHRWHISLSTWLRDYLYIPLGGNRHGTFNTYRNLMLTMLLGGLWHGAAWTFVIWGGLHGLYLVVHRLLTSARGEGRALLPGWMGVIVTFHLVLLTWIFFRASGVSSAVVYLYHLFSFKDMQSWTAVAPMIVAPWLLVLFIDLPQFYRGSHTALLAWPKRVREVAVAVMLLLIFLGIGNRAPFIYFQF